MRKCIFKIEYDTYLDDNDTIVINGYVKEECIGNFISCTPSRMYDKYDMDEYIERDLRWYLKESYISHEYTTSIPSDALFRKFIKEFFKIRNKEMRDSNEKI